MDEYNKHKWRAVGSALYRMAESSTDPDLMMRLAYSAGQVNALLESDFPDVNLLELATEWVIIDWRDEDDELWQGPVEFLRSLPSASVEDLAAADLLEVHKATGLNLTKFGAVEDFVNKRLLSAGLSRVEDNGA